MNFLMRFRSGHRKMMTAGACYTASVVVLCAEKADQECYKPKDRGEELAV